MTRRLKTMASARSSSSDPAGDSSIDEAQVDQAPAQHVEPVASTSDVASGKKPKKPAGNGEVPKETHAMKTRDDKNDSTHEEKDLEPTVVSGNGTETGQITVISVGGRDGQPKQKMSYMVERVVGTGSFGVVYQAKCLETGESVAIKKVLQDRRYKNRELQIMQLLNHPNVIHLKHSFYSTTEKNEVYLNLVLEYVSETVHRASRHYTRVHQYMPILNVQLYTYQVDPHTHQFKLCDFGSAKMLVPGEPNISYICSRYYRAPELIFGATKYTNAIDLWSAGCVRVELLLGKPLFPGESSVDQLVEIIKVLGTLTREEVKCMNPNYTEFKFPQIKAHPWHKVFNRRIPSEAVDLVSRLLQYSPTLRFTPLEACAHPFFDDLREPNARLPNGQPLPPLFDFSPEELAGAHSELVQRPYL